MDTVHGNREFVKDRRCRNGTHRVPNMPVHMSWRVEERAALFIHLSGRLGGGIHLCCQATAGHPPGHFRKRRPSMCG